jgi:hypothetical protein
MLALSQPAAAEVVVTRKTILIPVGTGIMPEPVAISLANNGVHDLSLTLLLNSFGRGRALLVNVPDSKNGVIMDGTFNPYALMLARGAKIGPNADHFSYGGNVEFSVLDGSVKYCKGYWGSNLQGHLGCGGSPKDKFLGVRFQTAVQKPTAEVQSPKNIQNQGGSSLGMLARGAESLPMWRRQQTLGRQ